LLFLTGRQGNGKSTALMEFAFHNDIAMMRFDNPLADTESEPSPAGICTTGFICPIKTVEYIRKFFP
jgi:hypothetical protein